MATLVARLTGADKYTSTNWKVAGTDLGIPYLLENGLSVGYLFGDTFSSAWPGPVPPEPAGSGADWRSPVGLRSTTNPKNAIIQFDSAYNLWGNGKAPELFHNGHFGQGLPGHNEISVIPNDGIAFPETGDHIVSYMSIDNWNSNANQNWRSHYAGLAWSDNGNQFQRMDVRWNNSANGLNNDPYQMWTMEREGQYVYVFSVRSGRQTTPIVLQRVRWDQMLDPWAYQGWNASTQTWGGPWTAHQSPLIDQLSISSRIGEPSVRRINDPAGGTGAKKWVMSYLRLANNQIVTRTAPSPTGPWSAEVNQVNTSGQSYYGGFIHPWSDTSTNGLTLIVSKWSRNWWNNQTNAYHVEQWRGTV